ncbi:MAG: protein kinase [Coriobacteriia bacterium]
MSDRIGPYQLRGELGRGAMAVVWLAWDPALERQVAVKEPLIPAGMDSGAVDDFAARFVREGKAAAGLNHPGIVTIHNAGVFDGRAAIVMELIEGDTLATILDRGPVPTAAAVSILDQLLDAVAYAHDRGVVHRDIKPDNVFVTPDGRVKLADFGIAHVGSSATLTQAGTIMGTPGYMAPEQVTGDPIDGRADIFAIGVIAYEMLSGRNPFGATEGMAPTTVMYRIVHEEPPGLPAGALAELPIAIAPIIDTALAKDPADRFCDARAFRSAMAGGPIMTGQSTGTMAPAALTSPVWGSTAAAATATDSSQSTWMPYAIVGGIAAALLVALLVFSGGSPQSGGGSASVAGAPTLAITEPAAGTSVPAGSPVMLAATATGISTATVVFMVNGVDVGAASSAPYTLTYTAPADGALNVSAKLKLPSGAEISSVAIQVNVAAPSSSSGAGTSSGGSASTGDPVAEVDARLQDWRSNWEAMDFAGYMSFYAPEFYSKYKKMNRSQWESYKRELFAKYSFQRVAISKVEIRVSGDTASTAFTQAFSADSFKDRGTKTLTWRRDGSTWIITGEEFR